MIDHLYVDGIRCNVVKTAQASAALGATDYLCVTLDNPANSGIPVSQHLIPKTWFTGEDLNTSCITGGHTFSKRPPQEPSDGQA